MGAPRIAFDHVHLISADPAAAAAWYADVLGGTIAEASEVRGAPQIAVAFDGAILLVRGRRPGEQPARGSLLEYYDGFVSHNRWGTDHFGFRVTGDFDRFCDELRTKGVAFAVEPYEFMPGRRIAYIEGPDGVTIELLEPRG